MSEEEYEQFEDENEYELEELEMQTFDAREEETNYYKENIFNTEDYYLYRGVMNFYAGNADKALQDFERTSTIMHS